MRHGAIVIQDVQQFIKEAERQINSIEIHRPLPNDQTERNYNAVHKTIK